MQGSDPDETDVEPSTTREKFGRYELVAELAAGGMASVYLARLVGEEGVARVVAVKRIHPHLARDKAFAEMFLDEARIASRIDHPNVCHVLEYGREGGVSFLAMEFLAGEPLHRILARVRSHPELRSDARAPYVLAGIVAEACDGLHAAHELRDEQGKLLHVVHRDVSPHNLFVTFDGAVKVVDFGIASAANKVHHTETGTVKGKFAYMAPEQLAGAPADRRLDVWALGVVLWESLTLERLFRRESPSEVVRAVEEELIAPPSSLAPHVPTTFDDVVSKALTRDPAARYGTARELATALRTIVRASGHVVDRSVIAEWMTVLFPDGSARRQEWVSKAAAGDVTSSTLAGTAGPQRPSLPTVPDRREALTATRLAGESAEIVAAPAGAALPRMLVAGALVALGVGGLAWWASSSPPSGSMPRLAAHADAATVPDAAVPRDAGLDGWAAPDASEDPSDAAAQPIDSGHRSRPDALPPPPVPPREEPPPPPPPPPPADERSACVIVGGGVAASVDGQRYDGPRSRCISVAPGAHSISAQRMDTGEALWAEQVTLAPAEQAAVTPTGLRRTR